MSETPNPPDTPVTPPRRTPRRPLETAYDRRIRRRRWVTYGLFALSTVLMANALVGETGYLATLRARRDYNGVMASLAKIRRENQDLQWRARQLRHDPATLEETARRELNLTRPGEVLVIIKDKD